MQITKYPNRGNGVDELPLCVAKRGNVNIKFLAEIFFVLKKLCARNFAMRLGISQCVLALAKRSDCKAVAACLCGAVIWKSFEFIAEPNLIGTKTIRVQAK